MKMRVLAGFSIAALVLFARLPANGDLRAFSALGVPASIGSESYHVDAAVSAEDSSGADLESGDDGVTTDKPHSKKRSKGEYALGALALFGALIVDLAGSGGGSGTPAIGETKASPTDGKTDASKPGNSPGATAQGGGGASAGKSGGNGTTALLGSVTHAPESASLALLIPGLLPLSLILRANRKRKRS